MAVLEYMWQNMRRHYTNKRYRLETSIMIFSTLIIIIIISNDGVSLR